MGCVYIEFWCVSVLWCGEEKVVFAKVLSSFSTLMVRYFAVYWNDRDYCQNVFVPSALPGFYIDRGNFLSLTIKQLRTRHFL